MLVSALAAIGTAIKKPDTTNDAMTYFIMALYYENGIRKGCRLKQHYPMS